MSCRMPPTPICRSFTTRSAIARQELRDLGAEAKRIGLRLSMHPSQFIVINSPDPEIQRKSIWDLQSQADLLDAMDLGS